MTILLLIALAVYVVAAWKHLRIRHDDAHWAIRLIHLLRMSIFLFMAASMTYLDPTLGIAAGIYIILTAAIWTVDDRLTLIHGTQAKGGTAQAFQRLRERRSTDAAL